MHTDELAIVEGSVVRAWELKLEEVVPEGFEKAMKEIKSGERKPFMANGTHPALRSIIKGELDRRRVVGLFNQVYDFLVAFKIKYVCESDYSEYNRKFGRPLRF